MPLRRLLAPIHPDGWKFVAAAALVTVVLFVFAPAVVGWVGLILTLWVAYFFRDPWRVTPTRAGLVISPADGVIVSLGQAPPPPELAMGTQPVTRIGIFLNLFDVHIARAPAAGRIVARHYTKGRFLNASIDKASDDNERLAIRLAPAQFADTGSEAADMAVVLIAGLVARRIVCPLFAGQRVVAGERIGLIRFGSRVDVYLPSPFVPLVMRGQRTIAGETVLADCRAGEAPRGGIAH